ncbi:hypothetical protein A6P36_02920 [Candidatus Arthromitus sp. SFB-turkey]|nr:hypothetical protein A6P36_02920 [Candidatus Arthromitus sp. SFB-turkey]
MYGCTISTPLENDDVDCNTVVLPKALFLRKLDKTAAGVPDVVSKIIVFDVYAILLVVYMDLYIVAFARIGAVTFSIEIADPIFRSFLFINLSPLFNKILI